MKKKLTSSLVIAAALLQGVYSEAQSTDAWRGSVEFNPMFYTESGADMSFNVNLTATRKVYDFLSVGAGIGVVESFNFKTDPIVPVFARFQAEDNSRAMSPFVTMDLGYGLNTGDLGTGGLIINPTVGFKYDAFSIGVGYYGYKSFASGAKMSNAINVRLGYNFGYHRSTSPLAKALRRLEFSIDLGMRFPMGTSYNDYQEEISTLTTIWNEDWIDERHTLEQSSGYAAIPDMTLALLYPVTDNFYAGLMAGFNLIRQKAYAKIVNTYYDYPDIVRGEYENNLNNPDDPYEIQTSAQVGLRMKYKFKEIMIANRFYPFAQVDLGWDANWNHESSFFCNPTAGLSIDVAGGNHSIDLGVSYVTQRLEKRTFDMYGEYGWHLYENVDYENVGALRISLGYTF